MKSVSTSSLKRIVNIVLTIALIAFSYLYISDLIHTARTYEVKVDWQLLFTGSVVFAVSCIIFSFHWRLSSRLIDKTASNDQYFAFLASLPYKYLPTSFFTISSRAVYGKKLGLSIKQALVSQVFENISLLLANFWLFALIYMLKLNTTLGILILALTSVCVYMFLRVRPILKLRYKTNTINLISRDFAKMLVVATAGWITCGLAFALTAKALGLEPGIFKALAANTIAFSAGMLVFFAPGGIGVRELIYASFGIASPVIVVWRILVFIVDFMVGLPALAYVNTKQR